MSLSVLLLQSGNSLQGGVASYLSELLRASRGSEIKFFVSVSEKHATAESTTALYEGAVLCELPPTYGFWSLLRRVLQLKQIIQSRDIKLIHAHALRSGFLAAVAGVITGTPVVYTNHGLRYRQKVRLLSRALFFIAETLVLLIAKRVCSIRPSDHHHLSARFPTLRGRFVLIRTEICVSETVPSLEQRNPERLVLGIGSLIPVKRPDRFAGWVHVAKARGTDFRARWIGDGPLRSALLSCVEDTSAQHIDLEGWVPRSIVSDYLARANVLLVTSDFEVLPLVVLEAYAHGVPVITSRYDGVEDFVLEGETGFIIEGDDYETASQRLSALINNVRLRAKMGTAAVAFYSDRFSNPRRMANAYRDAYFHAYQSGATGC